MKRARTLLVRALVGALLVLTLGAGVASADPGTPGGSDGGSAPNILPEDPGIGE
jgi:hypothetical protein